MAWRILPFGKRDDTKKLEIEEINLLETFKKETRKIISVINEYYLDPNFKDENGQEITISEKVKVPRILYALMRTNERIDEYIRIRERECSVLLNKNKEIRERAQIIEMKLENVRGTGSLLEKEKEAIKIIKTVDIKIINAAEKMETAAKGIEEIRMNQKIMTHEDMVDTLVLAVSYLTESAKILESIVRSTEILIDLERQLVLAKAA